MNIHFIFLDIENMENQKGDVHFGIASLSAVLKAEGHKVTLTHLRAQDRKDYIEKTIGDVRKNKPDIIGFSLTELDEYYFTGLNRRLKEEFETPIIVGGAYPTIAPEKIINTYGVDIVARGEAEKVLVNLLERMERGKSYSELSGLWVNENGKVHRNVMDEPPDITELPSMDFSIFDDETVVGGIFDGKVKLGYLCNRGCPYQCTYCVNYHLKHSYPKGSKYVRFQKIDKIIDHLVYLRGRYKFDIINFFDDTFLLNKKWVNEFSARYKKEIDMPFICNARPETATKEMMATITHAGCTYMAVGLESGNETLRKQVLKRRPTNEQIIANFKLADEFGIKTYTYNMVGIPTETEKNILETIMLNATVKPYVVGVSAFYPFHGTQLGEMCYENGWVIETKREQTRSFLEGSIVDYPQLSNKLINWYHKNFVLLYYSKVDIRTFLWEIVARGMKRLNIHGKIGLRKWLRGMPTGPDIVTSQPAKAD